MSTTPDLPPPAFRLIWRDGQYRVSAPNIGDTDCYTAELARTHADNCIRALTAERDAALARAEEAEVRAGSVPAAVTSWKLGEWFKAASVDDMQGFFRSRLPAIREAAQEHGYAIGVHGSERRDFDLMAMPWRDGASDADTLAHAIAKAAIGIARSGPYEWEAKPLGRTAVSIPMCWTQRHDVPSDGHIDLSVIAAPGTPPDGIDSFPWPTMPPSRGQSPVLFEDGYAEGWAKCLAQCKENLHGVLEGSQGIIDGQAAYIAQISTPPDEATSRAQFEAWARKRGYDTKRAAGKRMESQPQLDYEREDTGDAWTGWRAARTQGDAA